MSKDSRVKITKFSKYVFRLPPFWFSLVGIGIISLIFTLIKREAFLILAIPSFVTIIVLSLLKIDPKKAAFLSFLATCIVSVFYPISFFDVSFLIFAFSLITIPYFLAFRYSFPFPRSKSILLSIVHSILGFVVLSFNIPLPILIPKAFFTLLMLSLFTTFYLYAFDYPMKKIFGVGALEFGMGLVVHWTSNDLLLESILDKVGEEVETKIVRLTFKGDNDTFHVFIPYFHLGPFGNVGGAAFTEIVKARYPNAAVLHGTATHDFNPIQSDLAHVLNVPIKYWGGASKSKRIGKKPSLLVQSFAGKRFIFSTFSPSATEDIDYGLGLALMEAGNCFFVDTHNCFEPGYHSVDVGSEKGEMLLKEAKKIGKMKLEEKEVKWGWAFDDFYGYDVEDGIGPLGLRVLVVEVDKQKTAYVMFDANNIVKGLREKIINVAKKYVDECKVLTSDTHCVNLLSQPENPLGKNIPETIILEKVERCLQSIKLKKGKVGWGVKEVKLKVFGSKRTAELVASANTTLHFMKIFAPFTLIVGICISLLVCLVI